METRQIEQLYVTKTTHKSKNGTIHRYNLWAKLKDEPVDRKLLTDIQQPRQFQYLEQIIEEFLQIDDRPISGEWDIKPATRLGFDLAEALDLTLSAGYDYLAVRGNRGDTRIDFTIQSLYEEPNSLARVSLQNSPQPAPITPAETERLFDLKQRGVRLSGQLKPQNFKEGLVYEEKGIIAERHAKPLLELMAELVTAQPSVVATGSELAPLLYDSYSQKGHLLRHVAADWLRRIADDTTKRLSSRTEGFICADCLTYLDAFSFKLGFLERITTYGCRTCGQSRRLIETPDGVEAVLDRRWDANDEAVERFTVQVGNDTDPVRRPRYKKMAVTIAPDSPISENSRRILERTFGNIEQR